jgi:hypothetical protein
LCDCDNNIGVGVGCTKWKVTKWRKGIREAATYAAMMSMMMAAKEEEEWRGL